MVRTSATKGSGTQQLGLLEVATELSVQTKQNQNSIQLQIKDTLPLLPKFGEK